MWTILIRCVAVTININEKGLWFLNTLLTTFFVVMFIYFALDTIFPFFCFFLLLPCTFEPQNADGSCCELQ